MPDRRRSCREQTEAHGGCERQRSVAAAGTAACFDRTSFIAAAPVFAVGWVVLLNSEYDDDKPSASLQGKHAAWRRRFDWREHTDASPGPVSGSEVLTANTRRTHRAVPAPPRVCRDVHSGLRASLKALRSERLAVAVLSGIEGLNAGRDTKVATVMAAIVGVPPSCCRRRSRHARAGKRVLLANASRW